MSDKTELLPCPFCGGLAYVHEHYLEPFGYSVGCSTYDCRGKRENTGFTYETEAEAIAAWNARAERTCEPTEEWCCDHCGADLVECNVGVAAGGGAYELDPPILVNYCPNCGARVKAAKQ